jgi:hypothetical protein
MAQLAVGSALSACAEDDEVIVADNGDKPIGDWPADPRLRVLPPEQEALPMPDNWERALAAARGNWIYVLGDKHRLVATSFRRVFAEAQRSDLVCHQFCRFYQALAVEPLQARAEELAGAPGVLSIEAVHGRREELSSWRALRTWRRDVTYHPELPMLYNSLVHRRVVDAAKERVGRFFVGPAPDVASSLQMLASTAKFVRLGIPGVVIQIPGAPVHWSTGAAQQLGGLLANRFVTELKPANGSNPVLPPLICTTVHDTLSAFATARPELGVTPRWSYLAIAAAREIETHRTQERWSIHRDMLVASYRAHPSLVPGALQIAASLGKRLVAFGRSARSRLVAPGLAAEPPKAVCLSEAIELVEQIVRRVS